MRCDGVGSASADGTDGTDGAEDVEGGVRTGYSRSCPELKEVMDWCGDGVYDGYINWGF